MCIILEVYPNSTNLETSNFNLLGCHLSLISDNWLQMFIFNISLEILFTRRTEEVNVTSVKRNVYNML